MMTEPPRLKPVKAQNLMGAILYFHKMLKARKYIPAASAAARHRDAYAEKALDLIRRLNQMHFSDDYSLLESLDSEFTALTVAYVSEYPKAEPVVKETTKVKFKK